MLKIEPKNSVLEIFLPQNGSENEHGFLYVEDGISAGFPSPADDFKEIRISLDKELVADKEATFYARVRGDSMEGAGMANGDLLVIDKSIEPRDGDIAVCFVDGDFTVKRIKIEKDRVLLMPENSKYKPLEVSGDSTLEIWGVVTYVIKNIHKR